MNKKRSEWESYKSPLGKFKQQCWNAKRRGVEWLLTFDEWWSIWTASGRWSQRGKGDGQYVMARHGDAGPYAVGNVSIIRCNENDSVTGNRKRSLPIGVSPCAGRFQAKRRGVYLGTFGTPELAHAAYLMAGEQFARAA